jgi:hypothetical protein
VVPAALTLTFFFSSQISGPSWNSSQHVAEHGYNSNLYLGIEKGGPRSLHTMYVSHVLEHGTISLDGGVKEKF